MFGGGSSQGFQLLFDLYDQYFQFFRPFFFCGHHLSGLPAQLVLDMSGVAFMDSSGIAVLLRARRQLAHSGGILRVVNIPAQARRGRGGLGAHLQPIHKALHDGEAHTGALLPSGGKQGLYQLGCLGFLKAIRGFDTSYGTQFSTYAVPKSPTPSAPPAAGPPPGAQCGTPEPGSPPAPWTPGPG